MISEHHFGTYDQIAAWPIDRTLAANDLIDGLARFQAKAMAAARAKASANV